MKVLIVSKSDAGGGAFYAAYRLHKGLRNVGVDSKMLVDYKMTDDSDVYGSNGEIGRSWSRVRSFVDKSPLRLNRSNVQDFHPAWVGKNLAKHQLVKEADIINLHWITRGFVSIKQIAELAKLNKPIAWTLHDMWAFTGGCHYSGDCAKYTTKCGACPQLKSIKEKDLAYRIFRKKSKHFSDLNLEIIVLCKWMQDCVKKSYLLSGKPVHLIPNGLDTDVFKPIDKSAARAKLGLPANKKIVLFGALGATSNERKGFAYLKEAVRRMAASGASHVEQTCLAVFGESSTADVGELPFEVRNLGRLSKESSMALAYSAADVFVAPSLEDNLANTVMESLSCGTPVVAFNIGGMSDMIEHHGNGYLSVPKDVDSLSTGIKRVLESIDTSSHLAEAAREKAVREYALKVQAGRYRELFDSLVEARSNVSSNVMA